MPNVTDFMGAMGRGTDSTVGHLTPGEVVIPREVIDNQPQLMSAIIKAFGAYGENMQAPMDWRQYMVGAPQGAANPNTGAQEFKAASSISRDRDPTGTTGGANPFAGMDQRARPSYADSVASQDMTRGLRGVTANDQGGVSFNGGGPAAATTGSSPFSRMTNLFSGPLTQEDFGTALSLMPGPIGAVVGLTNLARDMFGLEGKPGDPAGSAPGGRDPLSGLSPARREAVSDTFQGLTRPPEMTPPPTLNLSSAMTPLQQRAAIATRATQGSDSVYRSDEAKSYYKNLLMRSLMEPGGGFAPFGDILPVEQQYLQQILGTSYQPTTQSVLSAIAAA